jgi:hypothetical protein
MRESERGLIRLLFSFFFLFANALVVMKIKLEIKDRKYKDLLRIHDKKKE